MEVLNKTFRIPQNIKEFSTGDLCEFTSYKEYEISRLRNQSFNMTPEEIFENVSFSEGK